MKKEKEVVPDCMDFIDLKMIADEEVPLFNQIVSDDNSCLPHGSLNELQRCLELLLSNAMERHIVLNCEIEGQPIPSYLRLSASNPNSGESPLLYSPGTTQSDTVPELTIKPHPENPLAFTILKQQSNGSASPNVHSSEGGTRLSILPPVHRNNLKVEISEANNIKEEPMKASISPAGTQPRRACKRTAAVASSVALSNGVKKKKQCVPITTVTNDTKEITSNFDETSSPNVSQNFAIPNKFWALMEPYCAEITEENLQYLENLVKRYESYACFFDVPALGVGKSSTQKRLHPTNEDSNPLQQENTPSASFHEKESDDDLSTDDSLLLMRKIDEEIRKPLDSSFTFHDLVSGISRDLRLETIEKPLAEKITACQEELTHFDELCHHRLTLLHSQDNGQAIHETNSNHHDGMPEMHATPRAAQSNKSLSKQLQVSNSYRLEKKLRQWQCELMGGPMGPDIDSFNNLLPAHLLPSEEDVEGWWDTPGDEVLQCLRQKQRQLYLIARSNVMRLRRLTTLARKDWVRQEICRRLAVADADVIEAYNRLECYRTSRKPPLKRDRDAAWKALKDRKKILKELEAFDAKNK